MRFNDRIVILLKTTAFTLLLSTILVSSVLSEGGAAQSLVGKHSSKIGKTKSEQVETEGLESYAQMQRPTLEKAIDPDRYVLGPDDILIVSLVGPETRSFSLRVLPEGYIFIPEVGAIYADGLTITEFRERLSKEVGRYFHDIEVHCYLSVPRVFRVFVSGEVGSPGSVEVSAVERVSDAILKSNGFKRGASRRCIRLVREQDTIFVDLVRFFTLGDISKNPRLNGGDMIIVPPRTSTALVIGEVKRPGRYEFLPGESIEDIIELAGGFTSNAVVDSVLFTRTTPEGAVFSRTVYAADYGEKLQDRDEISIFSELKDKRVVYVSGAVNRAGVIYLSSNEGLSGLLTRVGGFQPDADLSKVYVERKDGTILSIDLRDCLPPDPVRDIRLEDGDAVEVPRIEDSVTVGGEVNLPGQYPYRGDWTVAQYIGIAGGPTKEGSIDRIVIYSSDGRVRKAGRNEKPGRGDAIIVKRSKTRILGEIFSGIIRLGTLAVTLIVLTK